MKKTILALVFTLLLLFLTACGNVQEEKKTTVTTTEPALTQTTATATRTYIEEGVTSYPYTIVDSVTPFSEWGGEHPGQWGHRSIYYGIDYRVVALADKKAYREWREEEHVIYDDFHEMAVVQFIKRFNISRKDFEKINELQIDEAKNDPASGFEPYNVELIYTFDSYAISNYYRQYTDNDDNDSLINWRELEPWKEMLAP